MDEGTLLLTSQRLLYVPVLPGLKILSRRLGRKEKSFELKDVVRAEAPSGRLPRLRIVLEDQDPFVVILSGKRFSVPWSKRKWQALDDAIEKINAQRSGGGY